MPFRKRCRITFTNIGLEKLSLYYQINYVLTDIPAGNQRDSLQRIVGESPVVALFAFNFFLRGAGHDFADLLADALQETAHD